MNASNDLWLAQMYKVMLKVVWWNPHVISYAGKISLALLKDN